MTPEEKKKLRQMHRLLAKSGGAGYAKSEAVDDGPLIEAVEMMVADPRFLRAIHGTGQNLQAQSVEDLYAIAMAYLRMLLMDRDHESAATLLWDQDTFTYEPESVRMIWGAIKKHRLINALGGSSLGKTYGASAFFLLEWILDPDWTMVRVMSTKEDHVKKNLFGDMQRLYNNSVIPLPGNPDTESIATSVGRKTGMGIFVLTIASGPNAPSAIKGAKVKPRPEHPIFGTSSRTFLIVDEAQEVATKVFDEVSNLFSSFEEGDIEHTKVFMAANPSDEFSRFGMNCTPENGWEGIQVRNSEINEWESEMGWHCVRLNALRSENIVQNKVVFPRFFTPNGYQTKLKQYGMDTDHPLMWSEVYGMFPPMGHMTAIISKQYVEKSYGEWIFDSLTIPIASEDPAFTGDSPTIGAGRVGRAVGWTDYGGERHDLPEPKWVIQVDSIGLLQRGDTQDMADETMDRLKMLRVQPPQFGIDRTGIGQGVHDNIRRQWQVKINGLDGRSAAAQVGADILGLHFGEKATEIKICEEDTKTPYELYQGLCSELWYATAKFFEYDCIRIGRGVDIKTIEELVSRRGGRQSQKSKLLKVESKDEYKARGHSSPDRADALTVLVAVARMSIPDLIPKAPKTVLEQEVPHPFFKDEAWGIKIGDPILLGEAATLFSTADRRMDVMKD